MDMNRLTQKSQDALQEAQTAAGRMGHTEVDGEHLLLALLDQEDGLIPRLLEQAGNQVKKGKNPEALRFAIDESTRQIEAFEGQPDLQARLCLRLANCCCIC